MATNTSMRFHPTAWLVALVSALASAQGFVLPGSIPQTAAISAVNLATGRRGCGQLPGAVEGRAANTWARRRRRNTSRLNVLGPDGREIDIIRHREAYSFPEYWEDFYAGGEAGDLQDGESYDWFFGYSRLAVYLNLHLGGARTGRVLVVGCGNSEVSPKMWDDGWKNILNIDFCQPVIEAMEKAHSDKPGLEWKVMDARDMAELETGSFDAVIDKGMTDSIMHNDNFAVMMAKVSFEIARVLKKGGVYLLTDYRDPERVQELFERAEWEGGTLSLEGKITPTVYLLKGKRSDAAPSAPFGEESAAEGAETEGGEGEDEGGLLDEEKEAPEWLAQAIKNGGAKLRMEDSLEGIDVPPKDIGRDKPFTF